MMVVELESSFLVRLQGRRYQPSVFWFMYFACRFLETWLGDSSIAAVTESIATTVLIRFLDAVGRSTSISEISLFSHHRRRSFHCRSTERNRSNVRSAKFIVSKVFHKRRRLRATLWNLQSASSWRAPSRLVPDTSHLHGDNASRQNKSIAHASAISTIV